MESLRNLALNAVPLNAHVPAYFAEDVRIARIFKQLLIDGEFVTRSLTNEEVQTMELLKTGFIPIGWGRFKIFTADHICFNGFKQDSYKRDTLQNLMTKYGCCRSCNKLLFKPCGVIKHAFSIEKNELVPVAKMDSGLFNYITEKELFCEKPTLTTLVKLHNDRVYSSSFSDMAQYLVDAFPTVKPMIILRKKTSFKINIGWSLQEFFKVNKQWWGHDTIIDEKILNLYKSDIVYYVCTEQNNNTLQVETFVNFDVIFKILNKLVPRTVIARTFY
jgi:hypothetical protein